uniref:Uncharacterized protein n=1 Tax=Arundo donax TaxID=35708 RepID=A0A0A9CBK7_ARUDO
MELNSLYKRKRSPSSLYRSQSQIVPLLELLDPGAHRHQIHPCPNPHCPNLVQEWVVG